MRLAVFLCAVSAFAASPFDGTWKTDLKSAQFPEKPDKFELLKGVYTCSTCVPKTNVKADGTEQKVADDPYQDRLIVKAIDARNVEFAGKKNGKLVSTERMSVDESGNRITRQFTFNPPNSKEPIKGTVVEVRVEKGAPGSHAISGSWKIEKIDSISSNAITITFKSTPDGLSMSDLTGDSYTAKFDGKDYPYKGDPGTDAVSLNRVDENTIVETDKRAGKVISVSRMTVSKDGRSINVVAENKLQGTTTKMNLMKQ